MSKLKKLDKKKGDELKENVKDNFWIKICIFMDKFLKAYSKKKFVK